MKLGRVMLASAMGVGASGIGAFGQQQPTPPAPTTQAAPLVLQLPGADVGAMAQSVRQAPDPSAAVAAYAAAVGRVGAHLYVEDAYVRRMVEFNLPDLAEAQAQDVVKQDPNNDVARAVVAYVQGRRGQAVDALATIVQAAGGDRAATDPFVLRTAGQLVAWYDTRADKGQVPEQLKTDVEAMRQKLAAKDEYGHAYASARDAYNGQPATASAAPPTDVSPQQQPLQPQPQPQPSSYDTSGQAPTPVVTEVPPPVVYDDSYLYSSYPYGYSNYYYYRPSYYWPRDYYRQPHIYHPAYVPPVIIPSHHHNWDHGHDWHDGHGSGHGSGDHDGHDGDHGGQPGGSGGGGGQSPRVNSYNDTHVMRNRDDNGPAKRAIEPGAVKERPTPAEARERDRADVPSQPAPQPRQPRPSPSSDGGARSPKADVTPRTERKADPPAAARPAPSSPAQQPRSNNDRSGSQQQQQQKQQQQQSGDRNGRSR